MKTAVAQQRKQPFSRVSIVGLGYIGLPTASMFAVAGVDVIGVDVTRTVVEKINSGEAHIEEKGLDALVSMAVSSGKLRAVLTPEPADAFIIAVPTPVKHGEGHEPDLSFVEAAGAAIAPVLTRGNLVVLESTSPVGTTRMLAETLARNRPDLSFPTGGTCEPDVNIAYCPERIIPGHMLRELVENDRVVGGLTPACARRAVSLYSIFVNSNIFETEAAVAEMVKLTENAFRDVNIAFANELSVICDEFGIDPWQVINLANRHPRVSILNPGPGVGGHCIAVDPWFIVSRSPTRARLIRVAREVNDSKPDYVVQRVVEAAKNLRDPRIACFGLTYKADVDDFRESPALEIAKTLASKFPGRVVNVDPFAETLNTEVVEELGAVTTEYAAVLEQANVVVMLVAHTAFRELPKPVSKVLIDTVGFWRTKSTPTK